MIVEVSMSKDETKFLVREWWAGSPAFVINALRRQLDAARAIWPDELHGYEVCENIDGPTTQSMPGTVEEVS